MKNLNSILALIITFSVSCDCCFAQDKEDIDHVVYLIGNTAGSVINESNLVDLQEQLLTENSPFTVLHLGDIVNPEQVNSWTTELDLLFSLTEGRNKGQLIFTPGDKDWNNSDRDGLKMVRKLPVRPAAVSARCGCNRAFSRFSKPVRPVRAWGRSSGILVQVATDKDVYAKPKHFQ